MKKLLFITALLIGGNIIAQEVAPKYEKIGDLVKVTNFYEDGSIKEEGFYKNKVITGTWTTYNQDGEKTAIAKYNNGKKEGKWFLWNEDGLKEIDYKNNVVVNVQSWKQNMQIATK